MTREREVVEISCVLSSTGAKRPALAKDVPSDRQVRLGKINVARRSHSRRQQPIPPLTAACPPRAGAEGGTICGNIGSPDGHRLGAARASSKGRDGTSRPPAQP